MQLISSGHLLKNKSQKLQRSFFAVAFFITAFLTSSHASTLNHSLENVKGEKFLLSEKYLGKVTLVVNVASRCGYTKQYKGLQQLHNTYSQKGLSIVAFPANNFGKQEPGTNEEILEFCEDNYDVKFDIMAKSDVAGKSMNSFFKELTEKNSDNKLNGKVRWNFEKFLIDRDGKLIARFPSNVKPNDQKLVKLIETSIKAEPSATKVYLGRRTAHTMHFSGAGWLTRKTREKEESTTEMLKELKIKPGQILCDMGSGNGYHTLRMAKATGEKGKVYAADIQKEMLVMLEKRAKKENINNIVPVVNLLHDPKLPEGKIDLLLMCDVYHEFSHPAHMLQGIRRSLSEKGQVVLVEFRLEDPKVPIKLDHKMSKQQIMKEMKANGFKLVRSYDKLPWQHMLFFEVDRG